MLRDTLLGAPFPAPCSGPFPTLAPVRRLLLSCSAFDELTTATLQGKLVLDRLAE